MSSTPLARRLAAVCACLAFAACTADSPAPSEASASSSIGPEAAVSPSVVNKAIAALRAQTAGWHNRDKAEAAGYTLDVGCSDERTEGLAAADARGMGYHTLNLALLDDRSTLLEPELIVYSRSASSGKLRLAAFDYFIPAGFYPAPGQPGYPGQPPVVEGIDLPMTFNTAHNGWVAHIWPWMHNPDSMFDNFNPDVPLCECQVDPTAPLCTP